MTVQKCPCFKSPTAFLQQRSRVTQRMQSTEENTARAHGAASNSGRRRSQWVQTPFFIGWMKTWPLPHTASTKSQRGVWSIPSLTPPTPSPSTSCPAPTLWPVSCHTCRCFHFLSSEYCMNMSEYCMSKYYVKYQCAVCILYNYLQF